MFAAVTACNTLLLQPPATQCMADGLGEPASAAGSVRRCPASKHIENQRVLFLAVPWLPYAAIPHVMYAVHVVLQVVVQASTMAVLDAYTDNPGTWLFHCHLTDHIAGGMMALFNVAGKAPTFDLKGKVRRARGQLAADRARQAGQPP